LGLKLNEERRKGANDLKIEKSKDNLNGLFKELLKVICAFLPEFSNIDVNRVALSLSTSRSKRATGVLASITPLRYKGGNYYRKGSRDGRSGVYCYENKHLKEKSPNALYLLSVLVPKFFYMSAEERLDTLVHELYHIHPSFRGDLRSFPRPHVYHGPTPKQFQLKIESMCRELCAALPEIMQHQLLRNGYDSFQNYKRERFIMPKLKFISHHRGILSLALFLNIFLIGNLFANIQVKFLQSSYLFQSPQAQSAKNGIVKKDAVLVAQKQNPDKSWVFVAGADQKSGWVHKSYVKVLSAAPQTVNIPSPNEEGEEAESSDEEDSLENEETNFDDLADDVLDNDDDEDFGEEAPDSFETTFTLNRRGRLYEKPSKSAQRFSRVEIGDLVEVIEKSSSEKWTKVRIDLTGEEGWLPAEWLNKKKRKTRAHSGRVYTHTLELTPQYGAEPFGIGGGFGYYYNFKAPTKDMNSSRFEIGLKLHNYLGGEFEIPSVSSGVASGPVEVSQVLGAALSLRYIIGLGDYFFIPIELGGFYYISSVDTFNVHTEKEVEEELGLQKAQLMGLGSIGLGVNLGERWTLHAGAHSYLSSLYTVFGYVSLGFRF